MNRIFLYVAVFVCGFVVMLTEIAGARLINPYFGVGIYVWASLISVALGGLALGYWIGGILADKFPNWRFFYLLILAPAIPLMIIPFIYKDLAFWCANVFGVATGSLICASIIFIIPLIILGMISPFAIKMASQQLELLGKVAGRLYGLSTLGSLAGTLVTAFIFIPNISVTRSFFIGAMICSFAATFGLFTTKFRKTAVISLIILGLAAVLLFSYNPKISPISLFEEDGLYGKVQVVEYDVVDNYRIRSLLINGYLHGYVYIDRDNPDELMLTSDFLITFSLLELFRPYTEKGLLLGYGAGLLPKLYEQLKLEWPDNYITQFDVVEIDKKVVEVAHKFFGKPSNLNKIYIEDARNFVQQCEDEYEIIIVDVISADAIPLNIFSLEFFKMLKNILLDDGIVAVNAMGGYKTGDDLPSILNTLKLVFSQVRSYYANTNEEGGYTNVIFFCSDDEIEFWDEEIEEEWAQWEAFLPESQTVLTDDNNKLDITSAEMGRRARAKALEYLPEAYR